jgi:hypothetical protein
MSALKRAIAILRSRCYRSGVRMRALCSCNRAKSMPECAARELRSWAAGRARPTSKPCRAARSQPRVGGAIRRQRPDAVPGSPKRALASGPTPIARSRNVPAVLQTTTRESGRGGDEPDGGRSRSISVPSAIDRRPAGEARSVDVLACAGADRHDPGRTAAMNRRRVGVGSRRPPPAADPNAARSAPA